MGRLSSYLFSKELLDQARLDPKYFTRRRLLTLPTLLSVLLSSLHQAVQSELDTFFANLCLRADSIRQVSAQAFYQARYKISARVFSPINQHLMGWVEEHWPIPRWRGWRVVAADGTAVRLTMILETAVCECQERRKPNFGNGLRWFYLNAEQFQMGEVAVTEKPLRSTNLDRLAGRNCGF